MTAAVSRQILGNLETLLEHYKDDAEARGLLYDMQQQLIKLAEMLPDSLKKDLNTLLHLLVDCKNDNARLWSEIVELKERLQRQEDRLRVSHGKLAIRQVYHAVNEKLMRQFATEIGVPVQRLWDKRISNVGGLGRLKPGADHWPPFAQRYGLSDEETPQSPAEIWQQIKDGKHHFDTYVHEGSFPHFSAAELREIADNEFVGEKTAYKAAFLDFLRVDELLSEDMGVGLYQYE